MSHNSGPIILFLLLMHSLCTFANSSCTTRSCKLGENTSITCQFDTDVKEKQRDFIVVHEFHKTEKTVFVCNWLRTEPSLDCLHADGFQLDKEHISNTLSLNIPIVTEEFAGTYKCQLVPSDQIPQTCTLVIEKDTKTQDKQEGNGASNSLAETSTPVYDGQRSPELLIIIPLFLVLTLNVCTIIIVIFLARLQFRLLFSRLYRRINNFIKDKETANARNGIDEMAAFMQRQDTNDKTWQNVTKVFLVEEGVGEYTVTLTKVKDYKVRGNALEQSCTN